MLDLVNGTERKQQAYCDRILPGTFDFDESERDIVALIPRQIGQGTEDYFCARLKQVPDGRVFTPNRHSDRSASASCARCGLASRWPASGNDAR
jgi:hypothetical protein